MVGCERLRRSSDRLRAERPEWDSKQQSGKKGMVGSQVVRLGLRTESHPRRRLGNDSSIISQSVNLKDKQSAILALDTLRAANAALPCGKKISLR